MRFCASLNHVSAKLAGEIAHALIVGRQADALKELLARLISQHQASSDLLLWLARERSDSFADILGPEVFRAMLTAMERDQFNEKRSNKLRDYILDDQTLLVELIGSADLEVIKDLTRALQLSPCFDDMDKRSLLARIVKILSGSADDDFRRTDQAGHLLPRFLGEPGTAQKRIRRTGAEIHPGQFQGNCRGPQLRRLARKPRIQGRQGNAENPHAPQGRTGIADLCAPAAPILPTRARTWSASARKSR